jgi:ParB family chromosome partitioning protein
MRAALGKGLSALISDDTVASVEAKAAADAAPSHIPLSEIHPNPKQPRRHFDESALAELSASIKEKGVLQPILVAQTAEHAYEIIAGERRWRAAQRAGLTQIPAVLRSGTESERFEMALIENIQRQDLNPLEQAQGYLRLQEEFGMTQEKIAVAVGKDRAVVANTLRLLHLPAPIQQALAEGKISAGHARALVSVEDAEAQTALFERILAEALPVRGLEQAVRAHKGAAKKAAAPATPKSAEVKTIEETLQHTLGRKVELHAAGAAHQGWIKLEFYSLDDLDALLAQLKKAGTPA